MMLRSVASKARRHLVSAYRPNIADDSQVGTGQPGPRHRGERFAVDGVARGGPKGGRSTSRRVPHEL